MLSRSSLKRSTAASVCKTRQRRSTREQPCRGPCLADREPDILRGALREHVKALAVDIGPRTPLIADSLVRAANYIHSVFEEAGLVVREQNYDYYDQRVTNLLATVPATAGASAYYVVGAHCDTVASTPGADDNASAVAVLLELAGRLLQASLKAPVLFAAFTLEEPSAYLTGHQGSRIFIRNCQRNRDRLLGAIVLEMVGYTAPANVIRCSPVGPAILAKAILLA